MAAGRTIVIDWCDATRGAAAADVARTLLVLDGAAADPAAQGLASAESLRRIRQRYLDAYRGCCSWGLPDLSAWRRVMAGARVAEGQEALRPWLLEQARGAGDGDG